MTTANVPRAVADLCCQTRRRLRVQWRPVMQAVAVDIPRRCLLMLGAASYAQFGGKKAVDAIAYVFWRSLSDTQSVMHVSRPSVWVSAFPVVVIWS